jgi:hypothetical protein
MAVAVEMHNTSDAEMQRDTVAIIERVLSDRPGDWQHFGYGLARFGSMGIEDFGAIATVPVMNLET